MNFVNFSCVFFWAKNVPIYPNHILLTTYVLCANLDFSYLDCLLRKKEVILQITFLQIICFNISPTFFRASPGIKNRKFFKLILQCLKKLWWHPNGLHTILPGKQKITSIFFPFKQNCHIRVESNMFSKKNLRNVTRTITFLTCWKSPRLIA